MVGFSFAFNSVESCSTQLSPPMIRISSRSSCKIKLWPSGHPLTVKWGDMTLTFCRDVRVTVAVLWGDVAVHIFSSVPV